MTETYDVYIFEIFPGPIMRSQFAIIWILCTYIIASIISYHIQRHARIGSTHLNGKIDIIMPNV